MDLQRGVIKKRLEVGDDTLALPVAVARGFRAFRAVVFVRLLRWRSFGGAALIGLGPGPRTGLADALFNFGLF